MKQEFEIKDLIQKFNKGHITQEELRYLVTYFKEKEPGNELYSIYQDFWKASLLETSKYNSARVYSTILDKLNVNSIKHYKYLKKERLHDFKRIWKYAALFILAFSSSWLLNNQIRSEKEIPYIGSFESITVPYGSKSRIELPDGSKVILNSGSKLKYEAGLGSKNRSVFLEGEAFFEIQKDKNHPFYVNVAGLKIKVLGTSFNVKGYPEEKTIETTLVTGKVEIFQLKKGSKEKLIAVLSPTQKAVFEKIKESHIQKNSGTETLKTIDNSSPAKSTVQIEKNINVDYSIAWKDNMFVFDNERFEDVMTRIERWFDVDIELNYPEIKDTRISGKFDKETVEQAMKALTIATPFQFIIEKNKLTINK